MDDLKNPISNISFKGFMRATVIKRDDDKLEGRIGVNIHKLMPDEDHTNLNEKESIETPKQQTNFFSSESEVKPIENEQIVSKNFYWARPSFRFSNNKGKTSGNYLVPQIGELVVIYFEDNDPQKCRYLPFDIVKDGEKLLELEKTFKKENLQNPAKKPNIEILTKTPNNNVIGFDYNEDTNQYIVKFDNGNYFLIEANQTNNKIELNTTSGKTKIIMDDKTSKVSITSSKDIEINGADSTTVNTKTKTINASEATNISSPTTSITSNSTSISGNTSVGGTVNSNGLSVVGEGLLNGEQIATITDIANAISGLSGGSSGGSGGSVDLSNLVIKNPNIVAGTHTKITYDAKGLVTNGVDATTADIADSVNKRYVSDSQKSNLDLLISDRKITLLATTAIGGHRVVKVTSGGCEYASSDNTLHVNLVMGLTISAYNINDLVDIYNVGEVTEPSWSWIIGPIYLGTNGTLTQTIPTTGFIQQIATALSNNTIYINIKQPIII